MALRKHGNCRKCSTYYNFLRKSKMKFMHNRISSLSLPACLPSCLSKVHNGSIHFVFSFLVLFTLHSIMSFLIFFSFTLSLSLLFITFLCCVVVPPFITIVANDESLAREINSKYHSFFFKGKKFSFGHALKFILKICRGLLNGKNSFLFQHFFFCHSLFRLGILL